MDVYVYIIISDHTYIYICIYIYTPDLLGDDTSGARHTGVIFGRHLGILYPTAVPPLGPAQQVARAKLQGEENVCTQLAVSSSGKEGFLKNPSKHRMSYQKMYQNCQRISKMGGCKLCNLIVAEQKWESRTNHLWGQVCQWPIPSQTTQLLYLFRLSLFFGAILGYPKLAE